MLLWFRNDGDNTKSFTLGKRGLNVGLLLEDQEEKEVLAFRMPEGPMMTNFFGEASLELTPREKSWLLLIFDVPKDRSKAMLRIGNFSPQPTVQFVQAGPP